MKNIYSILLSLVIGASVYAETEKKENKAQREPSSASVMLNRDGEKVYFNECGAKAEAHMFKRSNTLGVVRITGVTDCSNYEVSSENGKLNGTGNEPRSIDIEFPLVPGRTVVKTIRIYSNSGKHSAVITARFTSEGQRSAPNNVLKIGKNPMRLASCGGTARLTSSGNGQYNIVIKGMQNCNRFDILEAGGSSVAYSAKDITNDDASFTLPKKVVTRGLSFNDPLLDLFFGSSEPNLIKIRFYNSYSTWVRDDLYLYFYDDGNLTAADAASEVNL